MPASGTRRTFLAQLGAAASFHVLGTSLKASAGMETSLKTDTPLDHLTPQMETCIADAMAKHAVPGLSVALIRDAEIAWSKGFGVKDKETGEAVDGATVFEAASLTKPVVAYAALALCDEGRLNLERPLAEYLPTPYTDEQSELLAKVTARHVLTHTTGFPNWRLPGRPLKILRTPGEKFSYSGEGFVYLQRVIEQLTDRPLDELLSEKVFGPLSMTSASLVWTDEFEQTLARGYDPHGKTAKKRRRWTKPNAAASLVCTAADYARFFCALLKPPMTSDGSFALKDVARMYKPQVDVAEGISWGLGIGIEHTADGDAFWHWGNNGSSYTSFAVAFPRERIGVVVFTNSGNGLKACTQIVPVAIGGDHPALRWKKVVD